MKQTISVTRALVELKRLDGRIGNAIASGIFIGVSTGRGDKRRASSPVAGTVTAVENQIQGSFDQVEKLIQMRQKLKSAIVTSNAVTKVIVLGQEMTVAEAIEQKSSIGNLQSYSYALEAQIKKARLTVDAQNSQLDSKIEQLVNTVYGSDKTKIDPSVYDAVATPQKNDKESALIDPKGADAVLSALRERISQLESTIDYVLSEANAKATIEVDMI